MEEVCPVKTREIKLGGSKGLSTIVDESDFVSLNLGSYRWCPTVSPTLTYAVANNGKRQVIYLHRLIMGLISGPRSVCVDHIDHNGLNNSRSNLRITNQSGNMRNVRKKYANKSASPYKGVTRRLKAKSNPWKAKIRQGNKTKHLGVYPTEIEAAQAYNKAAIELFGEFACLNKLP